MSTLQDAPVARAVSNAHPEAQPTAREVIARVDAGPPPSPNGAGAPRPRRKVAVVVAHGMGQQVPFETLEGVAYAIRDAEHRAHGTPPVVHTRFVRLGEELLSSAALAVTARDGERELHLFEAYWAPLTEGKITLRETIEFLIRAGRSGAWQSRLRGFDRLMFNRWFRFGLGRALWMRFVVALLTILSLVIMNLVIFGIMTPALMFQAFGNHRASPLLVDLIRDIALVIQFGIPGALLGVVVPSWIRHRGRDGRFGAMPAALAALYWGMVGVALVSVITMGVLLVTHLILSFVGGSPAGPIATVMAALVRVTPWIAPPDSTGSISGTVPALLLVWAGAFYATYVVRNLILQYVGDVAIYVSSHTVSRFAETREAIQKRTLDVMKAVFSARGAGGFEYDRVLVVGHSLGSVVAYDVLNRLLVEDALPGATCCDVAARTGLFLTFGSPLDKIAFIFRSQRPVDCSVRESLAEARQPMITDYAQRPHRWINLHSPNDWIGAALDYFDDDAPDAAKRVCNVIDREATTPLVAHTEHWSGVLLSEVLYRGAIDDLPPDEAALQAFADRPEPRGRTTLAAAR